jgi:ubiquinone/menaquinone biosynthesis C-methylase UbiE
MKKEHFTEIADRYDESLPKHVQQHYLEIRLRFICDLLKSGSILDVGCGTAKLARALKRKGYDIYGLDYSEGMLKVAQQNDNISLIMALSSKLPFKSDTFDLTISIALLHHLVYKKIVLRTIQEMIRVTKKNGKILIWDHSPLNPYWKVIMRKVPQDTGEEKIIPLSEIINILKKKEIKNITTWRRGFIPDFIPKVLLPLGKKIEKVVENIPILNYLAAHNVILVEK